ncbi:hypothetical protein M407DRAFT_4870 [Tulasnella calospora MUT 4182]|uniref:Uncharacterized protein n=1 Tax=Tulasnella calospora MUT 4182 TaxID=1051891 RepID=A0A0C3QS81_9AGAM|nr:hypothetical protein M407DRAFT_4870 [Tulasnella calospora MUT 4182]
MCVHKGDVLVIPAPNDKHKNDTNKTTIHWQQMWRQREGDYYLLIAKNKSQGYAEVPFFIQAEWYNEEGFNNNYEIIIDDRHQYAGTDEARFVVWHDKDRAPYADRFLQTGILKQGTDLAKQVIGILRLDWNPGANTVVWVGEMSQALIGNYLQTYS